MAMLIRVIKILSLGVAIALIVGVAGMTSLYLIDSAYYDDFFGLRDPERRWFAQTILHIGPSAAALLLGLAQFTLSRPRGRSIAHKAVGLIYCVAVLGGALGAALILPRTLGGAGNAAGFLLLALFWAGTTSLGLGAAIRSDWTQHRAWMIRSYGLTLAGVTLRLQLLLLTELGGLTFEAAYVVTAWSSWTPNLLICEIVILHALLRDSRAFKLTHDKTFFRLPNTPQQLPNSER